MVVRDAPLLYKYFQSKLIERSTNGEMAVWQYRIVAGTLFHLSKSYSMMVLREMDTMGLVKYDKPRETVKIL